MVLYCQALVWELWVVEKVSHEAGLRHHLDQQNGGFGLMDTATLALALKL